MRSFLALQLGVCLVSIAAATAGEEAALPPLSAARAQACFARALAQGLAAEGTLLLVSAADQRLALIRAGKVLAHYRVSTSLRGLGSAQDSEQTPPGWHRVAEWIGATARPGQVFVARRPTAEVLPPAAWRAAGGGDLVLTRIMWLEGLEPGRNRGAGVDSNARFIYLHGTNQEQLLGQPVSHGCIRLSNRDIMEIFDLTHGRAAYCWIVAQALSEL
jgi:lipoprotein-anchoring transpeptidase ErfK/SrfK